MKKYLDLLTDSVRRGWTHLDDVTDLPTYHYLRKTLTSPPPSSFSRTVTIRAVATYFKTTYNEAKARLGDFPHYKLGNNKRTVLYSSEVLNYIVIPK